MSGERQRDLDYGSDVDQATFEQILEMDDEDDRDFSLNIFLDFKQQAEQSIANIYAYLNLYQQWKTEGSTPSVKPDIKQDLTLEEKLMEVSHLGHFLKGSSATLGLIKVQRGCELIQHYGALKDRNGDATSDSPQEFENRLRDTIREVNSDYKVARMRLDRFYRV